MKKTLLLTLLTIALATGIIMTSNDTGTTISNNNNLKGTLKNTEDDRPFVKYYKNSIAQSFAKKIQFEEIFAAEPKDEYVDYDLELLLNYFKSKGWKLENIKSEVVSKYEVKKINFDLSNGNDAIALHISLFKGGTVFAAKQFIYPFSQSTSMNPPYFAIPKHLHLGTLAVYMQPDQAIYWFYRNAYAVVVPLKQTDTSMDTETKIAQEVQKIFNEHTKKIKQ